jgi:hypothetical protein
MEKPMGELLDLQQYRRRRAASRSGEQEAVIQSVMEYFKCYPISTIEAAVVSACAELDGGRGFIAAMDAATRTVAEVSPPVAWEATILERNEDRLKELHRHREHRTAALLAIAEHMIRAYLKGQPETEITQALQRAYRVLMGNGSLCTAIYHATNIDASA